MTQNRRIVLNIAATYGRSLYALVVGLIAGRWALLSLGEVDFGLYGLVGGLITFVTFLNSLMATAVGRYYAYAVGESRTSPMMGLQKCREWFSTAIVIHFVLPVILVLIGYPCGLWAIRNFLTIPVERLDACVWIWRFAAISCFVSMVNVPFQAMYTAKQEIAELTVYGVASSTFRFLFLSYMITHPGDWLVRYAAWTCVIMVLPQLVICIRALATFQECRLVKKNFLSWRRTKDLLMFASGRFICALSQIMWIQGRAVIVNKFLGPTRNAAMSISTSLSQQAATLTGALSSAFSPAITNACGAGDFVRMRSLCFKMCKFGTLAIVIFAVPLFLEVDGVLCLWLKTPPKGAASLCMCLFLEHCISRTVDGHVMGVFAVGKMAGFNATESVGYFLALVISCIFICYVGMDIVSVGIAIIASSFYTVAVKLYYGRKNCGLSVRCWFKQVAYPLAIIVVASLFLGALVRYSFSPSFARITLTTLICETVIFMLSWFVLCDCSERDFIRAKMRAVLGVSQEQ